jgi:uncharacterized membrane protein YvbJ
MKKFQIISDLSLIFLLTVLLAISDFPTWSNILILFFILILLFICFFTNKIKPLPPQKNYLAALNEEDKISIEKFIQQLAGSSNDKRLSEIKLASASSQLDQKKSEEKDLLQQLSWLKEAIKEIAEYKELAEQNLKEDNERYQALRSKIA